MIKKYLLVAGLVICAFAFNLRAEENEYVNERVKLVEKMTKDQRFIDDFNKNLKQKLTIEPNYFDYTPFNKDYTFDCNVTYDADEPNETPNSVHKLRPRDIKVIGALGDSITAALGESATNPTELIIENRGRSWSIGGDGDLETVVTLPNLIKKFNPSLQGFSTGSNVVFIYNSGRHLNQAVSGQEGNHIPAQAAKLIEEMKKLKNLDWFLDWKMVTIFVGGNDLCRFCFNYEKYSPKNYIDNIQTGLDLLYRQVPRLFVNLVPILQVDQIIELNKGLVCGSLHIFECKCGAFPTEKEKKAIVEYTEQYQNYTLSLAASDRYSARDDFAVVAQPLFVNFETPRLPDGTPDFSYLSQDCFHFSTKGHTAAAIGLWNNLLQPVGEKSTTIKPDDKIICPSKENPYFFTNKNSN